MPHTLSVHPGAPFDWISKIKANDDATLKNIYALNYPAVERHVINNNGSADDAKDVYQEAFLAVWRNIQLDRFLPQNESSLSAYIFQIAKNKWIDQLRSSKRKRTVELPDSAELSDHAAEDHSEEAAYLEKVKQHFANLGEQCRELLTRFYYKKESMREIAAFFSWTEASAKNNKYRCLQKLRNMILPNN